MRYLTNGKEIFVPAGGVICRAGEPVGEEAIFYVMEGKVKLAREFENGHTFSYEVSKDGVFGVVCTVVANQFLMSATAETNSQLYVWSRQGFETALSLYIEFAKLSIQELSRFLRAVNQEAEKVWINYVR